MPPIARTRVPDHQVGAPSRSKAMRMKPYTATLVITPLINAETWLGAAGCASGSQACSGTTPALDPAPISASTNANAAIPGDGCTARIGAGTDRRRIQG